VTASAAPGPARGADRPPLTLRDLHAIPVTDLKQVGPKLGERLAMMGIHRVLELVTHYPAAITIGATSSRSRRSRSARRPRSTGP